MAHEIFLSVPPVWELERVSFLLDFTFIMNNMMKHQSCNVTLTVVDLKEELNNDIAEERQKQERKKMSSLQLKAELCVTGSLKLPRGGTGAPAE